MRVTRLSCAIGLHTGAMDVDEATAAFVSGRPRCQRRPPGRRRDRGTFDPTYGIYTWGKWMILDAREEARQAVGERTSRCAGSTTRCMQLGLTPARAGRRGVRSRLTLRSAASTRRRRGCSPRDLPTRDRPRAVAVLVLAGLTARASSGT